MVLKTELCRFSGAKIYPGKASDLFVVTPTVYRKQHKKDIHVETLKKRRRITKKPCTRSIVGTTLEVIEKKRTEKPEVRDAAREAALCEIKVRINKTKDEKKAKRAEILTKSQETKSKDNMPKGAKGPKLGGGGGGKR